MQECSGQALLAVFKCVYVKEVDVQAFDEFLPEMIETVDFLGMNDLFRQLFIRQITERVEKKTLVGLVPVSNLAAGKSR